MSLGELKVPNEAKPRNYHKQTIEKMSPGSEHKEKKVFPSQISTEMLLIL